ncbi:MAG: lamin tail domain-containing protein [Bacteroidota bacterium]
MSTFTRLFRFGLGMLFLLVLPQLLSAQTPPPGLTGQGLRDWLKVNYYDGLHTTLGYSTARGYMYGYIDNKNNQLTCVYGGFQLSWNFGNTGTNPAPINAEHTVPQSFFGSAEPMRSDIHHLFPTYGPWNSTRSNLPFADINDNVTTKWMRLDQEQSTIPGSLIDEYSEFASGQFEPREDHKGDCARAIFYFYTMYPTQGGSISSVGDINTLYQWHLQDPPDSDEILRNDDIETYQGNRNPYVDNPGWVADAWNLGGSGGLTAPTNLQLSASTSTLDLSWGDIANETGYEIYRSTDNANYSLLATLGANSTSYSDASVSGGTFYYYYVAGYDGNGTGAASSVVSGQLQGGSGGGNATDLFISEYIEGSSFNKALEVANFTGAPINLSGYVLRKETNGGGSWGSDYNLSGTLANGDVWVIANSAANSSILAQADISTGSGIVTFNGNDVIGLFKNGTLIDILGTFGSSANYAQNTTLIRKADISSPNATYTTSEWDFFASDFSSDLGSHTFNGGSGGSAPAAPSNLQLIATTSSLDLSWDDVADEDGYTVYRSADNSSFSQIASLTADVTSYSDNSMALETTFYYYVEAFNTIGASPASNSVSGATLPLPPTTPSNLDLIATTVDLNLMWDDVADEDGYLLYRSDDNVSFNQIASLGANNTSYTDNTVQLLTTYYYYVVAFNTGGNSGNSNTISGQTESTGGNATDLMISEYIEGSSFNKAIEIANFTGAAVNMSGYVLRKETNGSGSWGSDYALSGTLANGAVWVIANSAANATILAEADVSTGAGIVTFNGNDALGLFKNGTLIDMLGTFGSSANYAQNITLVRKADISSPNATYTAAEWDTYATDNSTNLGSHVFNGGGSAPDAPANLVLAETTSSLDLSWDDVMDEDGYTVYRSADNISFSQIASLGVDATSYSDNSMALETIYYYYVEAYNASGASPASNTVSGQTTPAGPIASDLFISEYIEGSSRNRAIEIANFTGGPIDLSSYSLRRQANGNGNWRNNTALSGILQDGEVYVVAHSSANGSILAQADQTVSGRVMNFSGNDPIGLFNNGSLIDIVGVFNGGSGNFARNVTKVRKASVTDPNTTYTTSEWDNYSSNTVSFLGTHTYGTSSRLAQNDIIEEEASQNFLMAKAWPNPTSSALTVQIELGDESLIDAKLFTTNGQVVRTIRSAESMTAGVHEIKLSVEDLPSGLYLLTVRSQSEQKILRIVKH